MNATEKYQNDPFFHKVVDMLEAMLHEAKLTPSEVKDAAVLACINYELHRKMPYITIKGDK